MHGDDWYHRAEARRIADNIPTWQTLEGGWPLMNTTILDPAFAHRKIDRVVQAKLGAVMWARYYEIGGSPVFTLKQDGDKLTGHYAGGPGEAEVSGTIKGREIRFGFSFAGRSEPVSHVGTVDGDTMKGKVVLGALGEGTFTGQKQPKK